MARETPDAVLQFWFGELDGQGLPDPAVAARWFQGGPDFDEQVRDRFGAVVEEALAGGLGGWHDSPPHLLALVIVLDQLPRNLFRGDARSYAGDPAALGLARDAVDAGWARRLLPVERSFLYLPFEHSESTADQQRSCELFRELLDDAPPAGRALFESALAWAERHRAAIERFGRFPARNAPLGRESTAEELAYLAENPTGF